MANYTMTKRGQEKRLRFLYRVLLLTVILAATYFLLAWTAQKDEIMLNTDYCATGRVGGLSVNCLNEYGQ